MFNNAHYANRETGWNMDVATCEQVQLAKYETGHFYDWHQDTFFLTDDSTCRKITVVALLSDPKEFTGGDFELQNCDTSQLILKKGSLVAFPSYLNHRATAVTSGTRYSAALWVHGPNFK
jgi:PKHD-type hydroxylase